MMSVLIRAALPPHSAGLRPFSRRFGGAGLRQLCSGPGVWRAAEERGAQTFVESLSAWSPRALEEMCELASREYLKMGRVCARQPRDAKAYFRNKARKVVESRIVHPERKDHLLQKLELCYHDIELLQGYLQEALQQANGIDDDLAELDELDMLSVRPELLPSGTETRPLEEQWVMDVEVEQWRRAEVPRGCHVPDPVRSILLSNLPHPCQELDLEVGLQPCGAISSIQLCNEWQEMQDRLSQPEEAPGLAKAPARFRMPYAFVEFTAESARRKATRKLSGLSSWSSSALVQMRPRLNGILFREVLRVKRTKWKDEVVARPCYPQDVRSKRCLLLRGLPWSMQPSEAGGRQLLRLQVQA
ncbi:unnamed protein product, partial [Effrenium voratum]